MSSLGEVGGMLDEACDGLYLGITIRKKEKLKLCEARGIFKRQWRFRWLGSVLSSLPPTETDVELL